MLWLRTSDTETDRTKPRQACITSGINEPESSPELQKLQKRLIKTAQTRQIRANAIRQVVPYINNSCANKTLSGSAIASLLV